MLTDLNKTLVPSQGEKGLPEYYPVPSDTDSLLFYIQRNLNLNTVCYKLNITPTGNIHPEFPMEVFWIRYSKNGERTKLNYIQSKLAYGYESTMITPDTYKFQMVSYEKIQFFITKIENEFKVVTKLNDCDTIINNIYVCADDVGLFPQVRYIEFYGTELKTGFPSYQKIKI